MGLQKVGHDLVTKKNNENHPLEQLFSADPYPNTTEDTLQHWEVCLLVKIGGK